MCIKYCIYKLIYHKLIVSLNAFHPVFSQGRIAVLGAHRQIMLSCIWLSLLLNGRAKKNSCMSAGDCCALFELKPHGTAILKISNQFDIKPLFGTALFGTATGFSCVRLLAPYSTAALGKSQTCAPFTSHDFVN